MGKEVSKYYYAPIQWAFSCTSRGMPVETIDTRATARAMLYFIGGPSGPAFALPLFHKTVHSFDLSFIGLFEPPLPLFRVLESGFTMAYCLVYVVAGHTVLF